MARFYINIRVPVDNADEDGAHLVAAELLTSGRGGEIGMVADHVWVTDDAGRTVATWKTRTAPVDVVVTSHSRSPGVNP